MLCQPSPQTVLGIVSAFFIQSRGDLAVISCGSHPSDGPIARSRVSGVAKVDDGLTARVRAVELDVHVDELRWGRMISKSSKLSKSSEPDGHVNEMRGAPASR